MQYSIESWIGSTRVVVSGEGSVLDGVIDQARRLEEARQGAVQYKDKDVTVDGAVVVQEVPAALVEISQPVKLTGFTVVQGSEQVVYPTIDDVADQVKALVAKQGLPKTALLLQEFGAARAKDVAEEKRAGFIAKAKEVLA